MYTPSHIVRKHIHLSPCKEMICIKTEHFNINRILLLAVGLWPYQRSKLVRLQIILFFVILASSIIFQFTVFLTAECTPMFIIKVLSYVFPFMITMVKYNSFWINSQSVKDLLEQLQCICNQLKDDKEISIIKEYGCSARNYTINLIRRSQATVVSLIAHKRLVKALLLGSMYFLMSPPMCGSIFFLRIKESQQHCPMEINTEYFVDKEKYSNVILMHMTVAFYIGSIAVVGTGSTLIAFLKHACGMFKITSYRIEQAMLSKTQKCNNIEDNIMVYKKMTYAIDIHRKAMEFSELLISSFEGSFFHLIIICVASLSFNLVLIFQAVSGQIEELLLHLVFVLSILIYMYLANSIGQEIMDHNDQVFSTAYSVRWYTASLRVQKLVLFLLQKGSKTFGLNVGGLFVSSLECFAKLASASVSYFTVMHSMQK